MNRVNYYKRDWHKVVSDEGFELVELLPTNLIVKDSNGFIFKFYKYSFPVKNKDFRIRSCTDKVAYFKFEMQCHPYSTTLDFSKTVYVSVTEKVTVQCTVHGEFTILPNDLKTGYGCRHCGRDRTSKIHSKGVDEFVKESRIVHSNKYDYSKVVYVSNKHPVDIICPDHGLFRQQAQSHLRGHGCNICSRYSSGFGKTEFLNAAAKRGNAATLYLLKCKSQDGEIFYKIGITSRTVKERYEYTAIPYSFTILHEYIEDASLVFDLEKELHRWYKYLRYTPKSKFAGSNECFYGIDVPEYISKLERLAEKLKLNYNDVSVTKEDTDEAYEIVDAYAERITEKLLDKIHFEQECAEEIYV